ncbi:MAG TPA: ABC transporter substrate-binding protein [Candidatus Limnocylindria bacterium]|nr:ABC transporter substrate-binding protein [Candidatus Limnocylindria bacterium]
MARQRATLALMLVLATVAAACGGAGTTAPAPTSGGSAGPSAAATARPVVRLVVGYSEIYEGELPVWAAFEAGIFKANGLDVDLRYTASTTGIAALLAGETQVFQGGGSETLSAVVGGADLIVIGNVVPVYPYTFVVPAEIKTLADLKGKKVGVSNPGSTSDIATRVGLAKVGIDPNKDVIIVAVGSSQNRTAALISGAIQGGLDQPPYSYDLESRGFHSLFSMAEQKLPIVNNGIIVKRQFATEQKDVVQRYVDSIVQSIARLKTDKALAVSVYKKYLKIDDVATLERTWEYATKQLFPSLPSPKLDQWGDIVAELGKNNDKIKTFDVSKILDDTFVQSAARRGLDKP